MRGACVLLLCFCLNALADADQAARYSDKHGGCALIIWQNGRIQLERYRNGGAPEREEPIYSITKSLAALGTFAAIGKGLTKLDEPVSRTLTSWQKDALKRQITVRELLNQTSGLATGYESLYARTLKDKHKALWRVPAVTTPGTTFLYGPSNHEALEAMLSQKLHRSPLSLIESSVLAPIGVSTDYWRRDAAGQPYFSAGARLSARDLLKVGHLVRRNGWNWIFPILPSQLMTEISRGSKANAMYGLSFWLNGQAGQKNVAERDVEEAIFAGLSAAQWQQSCLSKAAPSDLIAMVGSRGQRVYISRSQNLVIVRLGREKGFRDPDFLRAYFGR